jgi:WD40 repeat protein
VPEAHKGKITGLCFADEDRLLSCGVDRNIKLWDTRPVDENGAGPSKVCNKVGFLGIVDLRTSIAFKHFPGKNFLQVRSFELNYIISLTSPPAQ